MKKRNAAAGALLGMTLAAGLNGADLIKDGVPAATLYHPALKSQAEAKAYNPKVNLLKKHDAMSKEALGEQLLANAVEDLNYHLEKMSSVRLPDETADKAAQVKNAGIVIGKAAEELGCPLPDSPKEDAYRIKITDKYILLTGRSDIALSNAVYGLLEMLGCEWVMPGEAGEIIPHKKTVSLAPCDVQSEPGFSRRTMWYGGLCRDRAAIHEFVLWRQRQKLSLNSQREFTVGGHVWGNIIKKFKSEFEKHPEYYALVRNPDGTEQRKGPQLETTNPAVIELAAQYVRDIIKANGWTPEQRICIPLGPSDGGSISESIEALAAGSGRINPDSGKKDGTDNIVLFLNQVLEKLEKEYPNLYLGFFLYSWHAEYPLKHKPHPHVAINVADINFSRFQGVGNKAARSRAWYKDVMEKWGELHREQGNVIEYRPYTWNLADGAMPYTKLKMWGDDIPFMKSIGSDSFLVNAYNDWAIDGPHTWLAAKMAWTPDADWRKLLEKYCLTAYGPEAAPVMLELHLKHVDRQEACQQEAGSLFPIPLIYDRPFLAEMKALIKKAEGAAREQADKDRVKIAGMAWDMLEKYLDFIDAARSLNFVKAAEIYQSIPDFINEANKWNCHSLGPQGLRFLCRFYTDFVRKGVMFSTGKYSIIHPVPDRLKFSPDPDCNGEKLHYFSPEIDDSAYMEIPTFSTTYDAQGLGLFRHGASWFRLHVPGSCAGKLKEGESIGLFLGGVDNTVKVWCNGKFIGGNGPSSLYAPQIFDLTSAFRTDGDNVIVIETIRNGNFELGTGGITQPGFLFKGPGPIENPKETRAIRVLPGGIIDYQK